MISWSRKIPLDRNQIVSRASLAELIAPARFVRSQENTIASKTNTLTNATSSAPHPVAVLSWTSPATPYSIRKSENMTFYREGENGVIHLCFSWHSCGAWILQMTKNPTNLIYCSARGIKSGIEFSGCKIYPINHAGCHGQVTIIGEESEECGNCVDSRASRNSTWKRRRVWSSVPRPTTPNENE